MYHDNVAPALAQAPVLDPHKAAANSGPTKSARPRHRRRLRTIVLGLAAIAAVAPASALAQTPHDLATPANEHATAVHRHRSPSATHPSITFTNPLGRSRGPGAGAGLL